MNDLFNFSKLPSSSTPQDFEIPVERIKDGSFFTKQQLVDYILELEKRLLDIFSIADEQLSIKTKLKKIKDIANKEIK